VLILEDILASVGVYRAWVGFPYIFYHTSIVLQLDSTLTFKFFPFKFNPFWLTESLFIEFVQKLWRDPKFLVEDGRQRRLVWKLKELKILTRAWKKEVRYLKSSRLLELEKEISFRLQNQTVGIYNNFGEQSLKSLEQERAKILLETEEQWRQCSQAIWFRVEIKILNSFIVT